MRTVRQQLADALVRLWRDRKRYYVKRGPINWAAFQFDKGPQYDGIPRAVAIQFLESSLMGVEDGQASSYLICMFSIGRRMSESLDEGIDEMVEDARQVIFGLMREREEHANESCLAIPVLADTVAEEWDDQIANLCGVHVTIRINF